MRLVGLPSAGRPALKSVGHVGGRRAVVGSASFGSSTVTEPPWRPLRPEVRVIDVEPSALDAGLVDLTVTLVR